MTGVHAAMAGELLGAGAVLGFVKEYRGLLMVDESCMILQV